MGRDDRSGLRETKVSGAISIEKTDSEEPRSQNLIPKLPCERDVAVSSLLLSFEKKKEKKKKKKGKKKRMIARNAFDIGV